MNLLVTGGAGFIGSHFVLRHVAQFPSDRIVVLDKLTYAADRSLLDPVADRITFVQGDIGDVEVVAKLLLEHKLDTIVNFAAETHVDRSIQNAIPFLQSNVVGVQALIEVMRAAPKGLRMLHISTDEVYGDLEDDEPPKHVGDALHPSSPYAASKAAGEMLLMAACRTYKLPIAITRCTNNYGPHQAGEKLIPTIIRRAMANQPIPIYGQGKNKRDWLYVSDHCDALEVVLKTSGAFQACGTFNIGADSEQENIAVAKTVLQALGKPESLISFVEDRPGHDWRYAIDSAPIRNLGWKPKVRFEDGIQKTVEWYKERL